MPWGFLGHAHVHPESGGAARVPRDVAADKQVLFGQTSVLWALVPCEASYARRTEGDLTRSARFRKANTKPRMERDLLKKGRAFNKSKQHPGRQAYRQVLGTQC
jgi:hypothetical protein